MCNSCDIMLTPDKPRSTERPQQTFVERQEPAGKKNDDPAATDVVPLEPHWAALVDAATD